MHRRVLHVGFCALMFPPLAACGDDHASASDDASTSDAGAEDPDGSTAAASSGAADETSDGADATTEPDPSTGEIIDACAELELPNVVDRAACPSIQGQGITPLPAPTGELCRRLFLDLVGRVPTTAELASACDGHESAAIVDELMAQSEYDEMGRRLWADELDMTSIRSYYEYLVDADDLVGQLYRGEVLLPEFAIRMVTHSAFTSRFAGQDLVGYSFLMFLGRDAAPHERENLLGLWRQWSRGYVFMHPQYYFAYETVTVDTLTCAYLPALCHSDLWGHQSVVVPPIDLESGDFELNTLDLAELGDAEWAELAKVGVLLTQQSTFYETAVDKSLERYLGYDVGVQLPQVQQALVDMMEQNGGDLRALEREILTSALYTTAAAYPDPEDTLEQDGTPDYWHGPMKHMTAEAWLDSIALLTAFDFGSCDHRFGDVNAGMPPGSTDYFETVWHPNDNPKDIVNFPPEANAPDTTYISLARRIGGCPDRIAEDRFTGTGLMISLAHGQMLVTQCMYLYDGVELVPPGFVAESTATADLQAVATHMLDTATLGTAAEGATEIVDAAVAGCEADGDCNAGMLAAQLCSGLFQSAPFLFY